VDEGEGKAEKPRRRAWKVIVGIAVLLLVVLAAVVASLDRIAKAGLEKGASAALGVETTVASLDVGVLTGSLSLEKMAVANPDGFPRGHLLKLGRADMSLQISSLLSDTVLVRRIILEEPVVTIVAKGLETNLGTILKNAESGPDAPDEETAEPGAASKKFRIGLVKITGARFEYQLAGAPGVSVKLPDIEIRDLGDEKGKGLMLADLLAQLLRSMACQAAEVSPGKIPQEFAETFNEITSAGREAVEKTIKSGDDLIKSGGEVIKGVGGLLKNLGAPSGEKSED